MSAPPPSPTHDESEAITPYSMHVSSRYLDLTRKKLELTRLPRELSLPSPSRWEQGTPKDVLEPLLDYWLDGYSWRAAESTFNTTLPQFRTQISIPGSSHSLRIHFVHKRSAHANAIPLLICHSWPGSFIEVQRVIELLTDPHGEGVQQAFHVVAPSIPGFGFSDASSSLGFGVRETAGVFDGVMGRLGYGGGYVVHGVGWGFSICRVLAMQFPDRCRAVHTANPAFEKPTRKKGVGAWMKYRVAKVTKGRWPALSFGYLPTELQSRLEDDHEVETHGSLYSDRPHGLTLHRLYSLRPQTLSFSLCDSPVGLLAALLDVIHTRAPSSSPVTSRSQSPFLSPVELEMEMQGANQNQNLGRLDPIVERASEDDDSRNVEMDRDKRKYTWTPTDVLNWVMMQWLPGPESSLRWLRQAHIDTTAPGWHDYCAVPLGISTFRARNAAQATPLVWGSTSWQIGWVKRHQRPATLPAWEAPEQLVLDLRECFGAFLSQGRLANLPLSAG